MMAAVLASVVLGQAATNGFNPADYVNVGIGTVLVLLAGRLMMRLWSGWSEYATQVSARGTASDIRADEAAADLAVCLAECAGMRVEIVYLKQDIANLKQRLAEKDQD
jgi:hypothetical protein